MTSEVKQPVTRIYRVLDKQTSSVTFCRARNPAQAINYVTRDRFTIDVAKQDDLLGVKREDVLDATSYVPPIKPPLPLQDKAS